MQVNLKRHGDSYERFGIDNDQTYESVAIVIAIFAGCGPAAREELDLTFDPGTGAVGFVNCVPLEPCSKVLMGGEFELVNAVPHNRIAPLNANGTLVTQGNRL